MNRLSSHTGRRVSLSTLPLLHPIKNPNPISQSLTQPHKFFSHFSPKPLLNSPKTQFDPSPTRTHLTTITDLLRDPNISPGKPLETALEQTGIKLTHSLFLEIFEHFDSSPKPLLTLFRWAERQNERKLPLSVFNSMVNVLGKARDFESIWTLILERNEGDEKPDFDTFAILIRRYARAGMFLPLTRAYEYASSLELVSHSKSEVTLFEILLDSLCKEGHIKEASDHFDRKRELNPAWVPTTRVYNILLNGWFRSRKLKKAEKLWAMMKKENIPPTVVTYGTLIEGYCRMRRVNIAIDLVDEMQKKRIEPNAIVYNPIIDALGEEGRFKEALGMMERLTVLESGPTISTYNSLVKGFCKAGDLAGASKILKMMISRGCVPTSTTYNYFFRHFTKFGKVEEGLNLYTKMTESGYIPDRLTYNLLVKMLCEEERLDLALQVTKEMRAAGCDFELATCTMLVHLMSKLHRFEDAFGLFKDMIRRGVVPQYLTYQRLYDQLQKEGMTDMSKKLSDMMASAPHSKKLPNTYTGTRDSSEDRQTYTIQKAEEMCKILKTSKNSGNIMRQRSSVKDYVSHAKRLIDDISKRVD
ncbi:hypothetical protein DCAR_0103209 [Daucus carota subsp. sativus]|uniref:Uncharacterized protein n=1 Tax=Daucus carota subsp. sativus TaxID=79200 RepID=A0A166HTR5_DAUCS|nr:PREDICTED: pentatricopeptide repeat-containing protein At5g11310, mitochondrial-like [Daucus carota subsp. sativus]WOG84029.1 hypothetical protein DCAR_0103209 [Daucus carota subsp. sativus]